MLGVILCNLPHLYASGSFHGFAPGDAPTRVAAGTSWNKHWATDYGPDVDKARKARPTHIKQAIEALTQAESLPELFDEAKEIATRSLASELMKDQGELVIVMTAYYHYCRCMEQDEEDIATILLLM